MNAILIRVLVCGLLLAMPYAINANETPPTTIGKVVSWTGTGSGDNGTVIEATAAEGVAHTNRCQVISHTGAVDVFISLNGTTFAEAPYSLLDQGATDGSSVLVTSPLRIYGFVHGAAAIKVLQNGGTQATAVLNCWSERN